MAEVVWQARRVSDGVLVDVTGDTAGTPAAAPTPNPLEAGGGGAIAVTGGGTTVSDVTEIDLGAVPVTDAGGGVASVQELGLLSATITLTDAQIKALPTTAVEIIPAPGAGFMIYPLGGILRLTWAADYTNIEAGCTLALTQSSVSATAPTFLALWDNSLGIGVSGLLELGDSGFSFAGPRMLTGAAAAEFVVAAAGYNTFSVEDVPLYLRASNVAAGNFTGGDPGNSLKVTVLYTVIPV